MLFKSLVLSAFASLAIAGASPLAEALPWAAGVPEAQAAAEAYAEAYAEALAIAHPDPESYALAASADDCAAISCHAACGYLILNGAACSTNTSDTYSGPYNTTCLCSADSNFMKRYSSCMECGWTLWKYYGPYVTEALEACSTLSTEPTGTLRCSTTLTDSYTKDANAGCEYGGACTSTDGNSTVTASSNGTSSGVLTSSSGSGSSSSAAKSTGSGSSSAADSTAASSSSSSSTSSSVSTGGAAIIAGSSVIGAALLALLI